MSADPIYLDCNATTPVDPRVLEAMLPYLAVHYGNPSSYHVYGQRAKTAIEAARAEVAALIGATNAEIVFTGCATEANNLALLGAARAAQPDGCKVLVTSAIEHPSVLQPLRHMAGEGWSVTELPVDAAGRVQLDHAANVITQEVALVSVMLANNETGSLQAVCALADLAHAAGALMHVDAAQAVGKVVVDVQALGADLLTLAGHKFYAPKGVGALYVRTGVALEPIQYGAGHEHGLRPGTENVPHIVAPGRGGAAGADNAGAGGRTHDGAPRPPARAARRSHSEAAPQWSPDGAPAQHAQCFLPRVAGWQLLAAAPAVAASTGSACHAGDHAVSGVLAAMGLTREAAAGAVRLSLGRFTSATEIDRAADALIGAWKSLTA